VPQLSEAQLRTLRAALDHVVPGDDLTPGAGTAGGDGYVAQLLGALDADPPRVWRSGRRGPDGTPRWLELGPWERTAWRARLDAMFGTYVEGLDALGEDFPSLPEEQRGARLESCDPGFRTLLFEHACESLYGDPAHGGNRDGAAWAAIGFRGDVQPTGYRDDEVTSP